MSFLYIVNMEHGFFFCLVDFGTQAQVLYDLFYKAVFLIKLSNLLTEI